MKKLNITAENFSAIREELKNGNKVLVNNKVALIGYIANTEKVSDSGKKVRTPFYYLTESGKLTSYQLKAQIGVEAETKGERKVTTFATIWEQASKLANDANSEEIEDAIKTLQAILDARKAEAEAKAKAEAEAEKQTLAMLAAKYGYSLASEAKPKRNTKKAK